MKINKFIYLKCPHCGGGFRESNPLYLAQQNNPEGNAALLKLEEPPTVADPLTLDELNPGAKVRVTQDLEATDNVRLRKGETVEVIKTYVNENRIRVFVETAKGKTCFISAKFLEI